MHKFFANSLFIGKKLEILPYCHSTNQVATEMLAGADLPEGTLILTSKQTAGKGQRGNSWESEEGKNLTFSVILKPNFLNIKNQFYLNMIVSLAIAHSLRQELGDLIKIKWPNDIFASGRKICGILIENSIRSNKIEHTIVGIGLNVNQISFNADKATSMAELSLEQYDLTKVLEKIVHKLETYYIKLRNHAFQSIKRDYLNQLYWLNEPHLFKTKDVFSGQIVDVDDSGRLVIESDGKSLAFDIKEVTYVS